VLACNKSDKNTNTTGLAQLEKQQPGRTMAKHHGKNASLQKNNNVTVTDMSFIGLPNRTKTTTKID